MKTETEKGTYVYYKPGEDHKGRPTWTLHNKRSDAQIGNIGWYASWRRYIFVPLENACFDAYCLREIASFLDRKTKGDKAGAAQ